MGRRARSISPEYQRSFRTSGGDMLTGAVIPLVDLQAAHLEVAEEISDGFHRVLSENSFIKGADVAAFEREFADFCGTEHCVGVANGTDAVELALRAAGLPPGAEVIVPANTFVASAAAAVRA